MNNNDILRQCRYAFDFKDDQMINIFSLAEYTIPKDKLLRFLAKEEDYDYEECDNESLCAFLDGLIILKRGKKEEKNSDDNPTQKKQKIFMNNNEVLKKLRIALNYKEEDMLEILKIADFPFSKSEFKALFRRPDHRNFRPCGDQLLRAFLRGLTEKLRKS